MKASESATVKAAMAILGKRTSAAKAKAARANGEHGGRPPLPSCRRCGVKVKAGWWRAMTGKAGFSPRHLSCPSCGCEGGEAWERDGR